MQSGRYTETDPVFWVPDEDRPLVNKGTSARPDMGHPDAYGHGDENYWKTFLSFRSVTQIRHVAIAATEQYQALLADGVAKEVARKIETHISELFPLTYAAWLKTLG